MRMSVGTHRSQKRVGAALDLELPNVRVVNWNCSARAVHLSSEPSPQPQQIVKSITVLTLLFCVCANVTFMDFMNSFGSLSPNQATHIIMYGIRKYDDTTCDRITLALWIWNKLLSQKQNNKKVSQWFISKTAMKQIYQLMYYLIRITSES